MSFCVRLLFMAAAATAGARPGAARPGAARPGAARPGAARDAYLLATARGASPANEDWPELSAAEAAQFEAKASGRLSHALRDREGPSGHLQWGQSIPRVIFRDADRSAPLAYDDVGDTAAWTGNLLAALVHKYAVAPDAALLDGPILSILSMLDFFTHNCTGMHGFVPRAWARPEAGSPQWLAFRDYFSAAPPYVNGSGTHGVHRCTVAGSEGWLWQGGSSRDTYLGVLFGLGSTLMTLRGTSAAAAHYALALAVFERVFDKLSSDLYFIVYPLNCIKTLREQCIPVNPTPTFIAAWERVALFANPDKYGKSVQEHYEMWLAVAMKTEFITPMGHSGYYGNNLLSECWYLIERLERMTGGKHTDAVSSTVLRLLADYQPHLQANLNGYHVAAANDTAPDAGPWGTLTQALLWDFPPPPDPERLIDQHNNSVYGNATTCSESCGCSTWAMLPRDRVKDEFVWQVTPTKLEGGGGTKPSATPKTEFGGAFLTPYWIWRSAGKF